jgi:uncharacterized protein
MYEEIIKWLVNDKYTCLPKINIADDALLQWLMSNRLVNRFYNKLLKLDYLSSFSSSLQQDLKNKCDFIVDKCRQQILLIQDIVEPNSDHPELFIKGNTTSILINNEELFRYSCDIDLFAFDLEQTQKRLIENGFNKLDLAPAAHEYSFLQKDDIEFELHRGFPIIELPSLNRDFIISHTQNYAKSLLSELITYNDLLDNTIVINNDITNNVDMKVLSFEFTVLIICLHIYKDAFWEPYKRPLFKINELFEVYDLIHHELFNIDIFNKLIEKYNCKANIYYVMLFLRYIYGTDDKLINTFDIDTVIPVIKLMNDAFGPYKAIEKNTFCHTILFDSFDELIKNIGYSVIINNKIYDSKYLASSYYASTDNKIIDFTFSICCADEKSLTITFNICGDMEKNDNFFVKHGDGFVHIWLDDKNKPPIQYGKATYNYQCYHNSYIMKISIDMDMVKNNNIVIAYGKKNENKSEQKVTIIPLNIDNKIIIELMNTVKNIQLNETTGHDWGHTLRVYHQAMVIAHQEQNVDMFILQVCTLLHDIADHKFGYTDEQCKEKIISILEKFEICNENIDKIVRIINDISYSKQIKSDIIECLIIQDADRLDAIGAIGIARTFAYGGANGRSIYRPEGGIDTISHFYEKLFNIKDQMNTKIGKEIADKRHNFMKYFIQQFFSEYSINEINK